MSDTTNRPPISEIPLPLVDLLAACEAMAAGTQTDAALRIWAWLRRQSVHHIGPWVRAATVLAKLGRRDEAETLLLDAHAQFADAIMFALVDYARGLRHAAGPHAVLATWAMVRERFPQLPAGYIEGAACLREVKQFDAAGALLSEARTKFPDDLVTAWEHSKIAEFTGDWPEALTRWVNFRARFPDHWAGYTGLARALLQLKRQEDADVLLREASQRFPDEPGLLPDLARTAEGRRDWEEALGHWTALRDRAPERSEGYLRAAKCLSRLGRIDEAESLYLDGARRFPKERWFLFEYALTAETTHRYDTAIERWSKARDLWPEAWPPYGGLSNCLRHLKKYTETQDLLIDCLVRFPDEVGPLTGLANLVGRVTPTERQISLADLQAKIDDFIARRGASPASLAAHATITAVTQDWKAYHNELAVAVRKFPHDTVLGGMFAAAKELYFDEAPADDRPVRARPAAEVTDGPLTITQILGQFDSLGGGRLDGDKDRGYGCEFGLIQRDAGIEPLSLLRWTTVAPQSVIRLLERRLEGVGDLETMHVSLTKSDEWGFVDFSYEIACNHTNMFGASVTKDVARKNISKRQKFLGRKLIADLEEARKIFVYRALGPSLSDEILDQLFSAVCIYGSNTLLYVRTADDETTPFTVRWVKPGLMVGYIDWFRDGEKSHSANVAGWRRVCTEAFHLWRQTKADHMQAFERQE